MSKKYAMHNWDADAVEEKTREAAALVAKAARAANIPQSLVENAQMQAIATIASHEVPKFSSDTEVEVALGAADVVAHVGQGANIPQSIIQVGQAQAIAATISQLTDRKR
jgi:hypothetical protein